MKKDKFKATAKSPANIAFIKYWGKKNPRYNIPHNDSVSMNLSNCITTTTVEFNLRFKGDKVILNGKEEKDEKKARVIKIVDIVREKTNVHWGVKVVSKNTFPSDAGIASSASGFSALAMAASSAAGLNLSLKELSILARLGSGSASRSVIDGFALWKKGTNSGNSFAVQFETFDFWNLRDIVVVTESEKKKKSSTEGHSIALTSPFYKTRQKVLLKRIGLMKKAIMKKDIKKFGELLEEEAIELHMIAMTSKPPIFYWNKGTVLVMDKVRQLREKVISAYFTMDAGPNIHVICLEKDVKKVNTYLKRIPEVKFTIVNKPCDGSRLISKHLF